MLAIFLVGPDPTSLAVTAEWKQYQAVLAKHAVIIAKVYMRPLRNSETKPFASGVEATFWRDGSYAAEGATASFYWSNPLRKGISVNKADKTWKAVHDQSLAPDILWMLGIGQSGAQRAAEPHMSLSRVTRTIIATSQPSSGPSSESGFETFDYHIDAGWKQALWFDRKTHLMTQFSSDTLGPMATESHEESFLIQWNFDQPVKLRLNPPTGYKESKK